MAKWHISGSPCTGELTCSVEDWKGRIDFDHCRRCEAWLNRSSGKIKVSYSSVDRFHQHRRFETLAGARRYAHKWIGEHPELGGRYAVSDDGIGKITVIGCTLAELFPEPS